MLTPIMEVRVAVGDLDVTLPILDDATYDYFLEKNSYSVRRASLDAARAILMQLSVRDDSSIDIFSIKGSKAAEQYRLALQFYLRDPNMNPVFSTATGYAGGISNTDMQSNNANSDNNYVKTPEMCIPTSPNNPFEV